MTEETPEIRKPTPIEQLDAKAAESPEGHAVATAPADPRGAMTANNQLLEVELPGGGSLNVQTPAEVSQWNRSLKNYKDDYQLTKQNDLVGVGNLLIQQLTMYRAQRAITGSEAEIGTNGQPTGRYKAVKLSASELKAMREVIQGAAEEIRKQERALGVDKAARESGGDHSVDNYISTLKDVGLRYGIAITKRVKMYEQVFKEAQWKLRLLQNGDPDDLREEGLTLESFADWLREEFKKIEAHEKAAAEEMGKLWRGRKV